MLDLALVQRVFRITIERTLIAPYSFRGTVIGAGCSYDFDVFMVGDKSSCVQDGPFTNLRLNRGGIVDAYYVAGDWLIKPVYGLSHLAVEELRDFLLREYDRLIIMNWT